MEKSQRSWGSEKRSNKKMNIVFFFKNKKNDFLDLNLFFLSGLFSEFGVSEDIKTQQVAKVQV